MKDKTEDGMILKKTELKKFITSLMSKYIMIGPVERDYGYELSHIDSPDALCLNYTQTHLSSKGFLFPQSETLFLFNTITHDVKLRSAQKPATIRNTLLFGIRPCDAMAISLTDNVFLNNGIKDTYYAEKRDNTIVMSFACLNPRPTCFCNLVGCGPDSGTGTDLMFFELKDNFYIQKLTTKGDTFLKDMKELLTHTETKDIDEKNLLMEKARRKLTARITIENIEKKLDTFDAPYWNTLHQKCLGCGICTYVCPTCHCFDITDEVYKKDGHRVRSWDSCMSSLFTLHASGHNPRPNLKQRMRQRIMHKFNYTQKNFGKIFCVGCGRCIIHCPVNIDVREILKEIVEAQ